MTSPDFRRHLRSPDDLRIAGITAMDAYQWAAHTLANPRAGALFAEWRARFEDASFVGITTDGTPTPGLFELASEGAPTAYVVGALERVLAVATDAQRGALRHPLESPVRRAWMNPEVYLHRFGLRLDEIGEALRDPILEVMRASLSPAGFERSRNLMRINGFLGELVEAPRVMNEFSYNFNLFGTPSLHEPFGWSLYGHHLCLNCLFVGDQMVLTPMFMGAEPNRIDAGPHAGVGAFEDEERIGLELMRALPAAHRRAAQRYSRKRDPAMPPGRIAIGDELHLAGAFRDNRVIPYEGARAAGIGVAARRILLDLIAAYHACLPAGPFEARMRAAERHLDDTHFCWIGGTDDDSPFYYRIQSPVLIIEFDHHAGVFLGNPEPEKFHIHTLVRTPNGNDYGMALVRADCDRGRLRSAGDSV
jgi:hypothetical protein